MKPSKGLRFQDVVLLEGNGAGTTREETSPVRDRGRLGLGLDVAGVLLVGAWVAWTWVTAVISGGDPGPAVAVMVGAAVVFSSTRLLASHHRLIPPALMLMTAGVVAFGSADHLLSRSPLAAPLGYSNANAAFFVQATIAGLMVAVGAKAPPIRLVGGIAAAAGLLLLAAGPSVAATGLVLLAPVVALVGASRWGAAGAAAASGALFLVVLVGTIYLGATYSGGRGESVQRAASDALSDRRLVLWHDAIVMIANNPGTGVGPGRFQQVSPTARADQDARWAHHAFLQVGAEMGLPGLLLLVGIFGWAFARLGVSGAPPAYVALGAASLAALANHACVDYVMHFAAVPLSTAGLVGAAVTRRRSDG